MNDEEPECDVDANGNIRWKLNDKLHRMDGPAMGLPTDSSRNMTISGSRFFYHGEKAAHHCSDIVIGDTVKIEDDVATVLRHVEGIFYEALLGNKKMLIVEAF